MKYGRGAPSFSATSRHSSMEPVGATKAKSSRASQNACPSSRAARSVAAASVPVATTAPVQRGSSAQAKPIQMAASITPGLDSTSGMRAYRPRAGSTRVLVISPGSRIGTWTSVLCGRPPALSAVTRLRAARSRVSQTSTWGAVR